MTFETDMIYWYRMLHSHLQSISLLELCFSASASAVAENIDLNYGHKSFVNLRCTLQRPLTTPSQGTLFTRRSYLQHVQCFSWWFLHALAEFDICTLVVKHCYCFLWMRTTAANRRTISVKKQHFGRTSSSLYLTYRSRIKKKF